METRLKVFGKRILGKRPSGMAISSKQNGDFRKGSFVLIGWVRKSSSVESRVRFANKADPE